MIQFEGVIKMKKQQKPTGIQKENEEQSSAGGWLWLHKQQELDVMLLWKQNGGNQDSKKNLEVLNFTNGKF